MTVLVLLELTPQLFARHSTIHISPLLEILPRMLSLYNSIEFQASRKHLRIQLALERECSFAWLLLPLTSAPVLFDRDPTPLNPYLGATLQFFQTISILILHSLIDLVAAAQLIFPVVCRALKDLYRCICHHSLVEKSAGLNKFGLSAGPRFDSDGNPVDSNQYGFEQIDPQARVLNYCFH